MRSSEKHVKNIHSFDQIALAWGDWGRVWLVVAKDVRNNWLCKVAQVFYAKRE
jgi:hypothetical protein